MTSRIRCLRVSVVARLTFYCRMNGNIRYESEIKELKTLFLGLIDITNFNFQFFFFVNDFKRSGGLHLTKYFAFSQIGKG